MAFKCQIMMKVLLKQINKLVSINALLLSAILSINYSIVKLDN